MKQENGPKKMKQEKAAWNNVVDKVARLNV